MSQYKPKPLTHAQLALRAVRCAITEAKCAQQLETTSGRERQQWALRVRELVEAETELRVRVAGSFH